VCEHQWWQVKPFTESIAHAGFSINRYALPLQVCNITVNRALADAEAFSQKRRRCQASASDDLDDLKQAVSASHAGLKQGRGSSR
jgi:hypothetical protein